jgi:hypothetical protein
MDTHYDVLEVPENATLREIKASYISKALVFHPDRSKDPQTAPHWTKISAAYALLSDDEARTTYDETMPIRKGVMAFYAAHNKDQLNTPHLIERIVKQWHSEPVTLFAKLQEKYDVQPFQDGPSASDDAAIPFCCPEEGSCGGFGRSPNQTNNLVHLMSKRKTSAEIDELDDNEDDDDEIFTMARSPKAALMAPVPAVTPLPKKKKKKCVSPIATLFSDAATSRESPSGAPEKRPISVVDLLKSHAGKGHEDFMCVLSAGPGSDLTDWAPEKVAEHFSGLGPKFAMYKQNFIDYGINGVFLLFELEAVHLQQLGLTDRLARARVLSEVTQLRMRWYAAVDAEQSQQKIQPQEPGQKPQLSQVEGNPAAENGDRLVEESKIQEEIGTSENDTRRVSTFLENTGAFDENSVSANDGSIHDDTTNDTVDEVSLAVDEVSLAVDELHEQEERKVPQDKVLQEKRHVLHKIEKRFEEVKDVATKEEVADMVDEAEQVVDELEREEGKQLVVDVQEAEHQGAGKEAESTAEHEEAEAAITARVLRLGNGLCSPVVEEDQKEFSGDQLEGQFVPSSVKKGEKCVQEVISEMEHRQNKRMQILLEEEAAAEEQDRQEWQKRNQEHLLGGSFEETSQEDGQKAKQARHTELLQRVRGSSRGDLGDDSALKKAVAVAAEAEALAVRVK